MGQMKKTAISSVVCIDIIDFSKKSEAEQQEAKLQLAARINHAVFDIPESDRVVVDTEKGAIISCSGALESALEDALFIALTVRDEVLSKNVDSQSPLYLLMAINLGTVRPTSNKPNAKIQGEGLLEAQQIMSFANPNQILVSRTYYDMASKLTLEVAQMFEKYDMHAYEDDIYAVRRLNEKSVVENAAAALDHLEKAPEEPAPARTFNWHLYFLPALLALMMLIVLFKWMKHDQTENLQDTSEVVAPAIEDSVSFDVDTLPDPLPEIMPESEEETTLTVEAEEKPKTEKKQKAAKKTPVASNPVVEEYDEVPVTDTTVETTSEDEKSTWDSIKDSVTSGAEQPCSQAERAMNQCN